MILERQPMKRNLGFRVNSFRVRWSTKSLWNCQKIEGYPRQTSIHAAGVVISKNLTDYILSSMRGYVHYPKYDAHGVEGNKMDFLGLRKLNLSAQNGRSSIWNSYFHSRIEDIDLSDKAIHKTKGIFQFEQPGAIRLLKRVKPENFEEVVATTLNRRIASDIDTCCRKHGKRKKLQFLTLC